MQNVVIIDPQNTFWSHLQDSATLCKRLNPDPPPTNTTLASARDPREDGSSPDHLVRPVALPAGVTNFAAVPPSLPCIYRNIEDYTASVNVTPSPRWNLHNVITIFPRIIQFMRQQQWPSCSRADYQRDSGGGARAQPTILKFTYSEMLQCGCLLYETPFVISVITAKSRSFKQSCTFPPCPEKKRPRYFQLQLSHFLVDF